jgi:hypothetical protein
MTVIIVKWAARAASVSLVTLVTDRQSIRHKLFSPEISASLFKFPIFSSIMGNIWHRGGIGSYSDSNFRVLVTDAVAADSAHALRTPKIAIMPSKSAKLGALPVLPPIELDMNLFHHDFV